MDYTLAALNADALALGKGVVLRATAWAGTADLTLTHLGDTEGEIVFNAQEGVGRLTLPEEYGEGAVKAYVTGADPVANIPMFLADPALRELISPTGDGVIGRPGRREVAYHTIVIMPMELYYNDATLAYNATLRYTTAGGWQKSATAGVASYEALTAREEELLGLSIWMWKGYFERPAMTFRAHSTGDVPKDIETAVFHAVVPTVEDLEGRMVTIGSPLDHGIAIDVA